MHGKVWKERGNLASLALCKARSANPRSSEGQLRRSAGRGTPRGEAQNTSWGALHGATRHPFSPTTSTFLLPFSKSKPFKLQGFPTPNI
ncbi:hypothetical protein MTR67_022070 [Solanum verrucosum]|uniref:Uncharacterized protein n=1 Tax=Solanum verrucosum TaxID=315347 RepID=A0AAF0QU00_SOLVR|nr:hypothetical protein MTR67_022070 [Solanum verrucosum]